LLAIWFVATFVMGFFARELATIMFFGWPLSFYMAAQGSMIIYLLIIWYYARTMSRLDDEYGVAEGDE
jgi:putative solute:sodium symporter small subunit